jgi:hypothetical protein
MFHKQKRDGKIKGRTVAGGNKQRDYISKEDASSPIVTTEAVLFSCIIDAEGGRDVAVVDIPNACVQMRVENEQDIAFIKICGVLVDILVKITPDVYKSYVSRDNKIMKQLLVQCQNALYGAMVASLLYHRKFVKSLTDIGFIINPYDMFVANKIIEGEQMTICFHVDDCKLSHRRKKFIDTMTEYLHQDHESIFKDGTGSMTVSRGKIHKYLGRPWTITSVDKSKLPCLTTLTIFSLILIRQNRKGAARRQVQHLIVSSRMTRAARSWLRTRMLSSTTWRRKLCTPPSRQDRIPAPRLHY